MPTLVAFAVGGFWEVLFAMVRGHEVNEGFFVTSILYALIVPATAPLWQVALGISFGVVIAKEVFGGTGKNFMNPALAGRAFLYFAYPVEMSGESVWVPTCTDIRIVLTLHEAPSSIRMTHSCENGVSPGNCAVAGSIGSLMSQ